MGLLCKAWYYDKDAVLGDNGRELCRWLGVAHRFGQALCYWILTRNGTVISRTTVQPMTEEEMRNVVAQKDMTGFDKSVERKMNKDNP
eukprot:9595612-Ditylum_brightwellii.AAC.1